MLKKSKRLNNFQIQLKLLLILFLFGCSSNQIERYSVQSETGTWPNERIKIHSSHDSPFIKLHLNNGDVYVLRDWKFKDSTKTFLGTGQLLDFNREVIDQNSYNIPLDEVVLIESNKILSNQPTIGMIAITTISLLGTVACIINPKACFGSCPTFYVKQDDKLLIQAEGFSSSVTPSMEAIDIDPLFHVRPTSNLLELQMKNEAMETQVIRSANLLLVEKSQGSRVYMTPDDMFYEVDFIYELANANSEYGTCYQKLLELDEDEWYSSADSNDLCSKEFIELEFENIQAENLGLILGFRQSLLATFLFYQTLAYMGSEVGYYISELERQTNFLLKDVKHPGELLGGIEVWEENNLGSWVKVSEYNETGPIAPNIQIIPLNFIPKNETKNIKLKLNKGFWRIDFAALGKITEEKYTERLLPSSVISEQSLSIHSNKLLNKDSVLVTFPGDTYSIFYDLPDNFSSYEYFLESGGYYLEWMREEWIAEENSEKVMQFLLNPAEYLKDLAPLFKEHEATMEESFWSSKYVLP